MPPIAAFIDVYLTPHRLPDWFSGAKGMIAFTVFYNSVLLITRVTDGHWIYPLFDALSLNGQAIFILSADLALSAADFQRSYSIALTVHDAL